MNNDNSRMFSIENNKILYDRKHLYNENDQLIFDNKYEIEKMIGEGANGVVFLAKHNFLNIKQVIKIYYSNIDREKSILEIRKNSNVDLSIINAVNHDAGLISTPAKMYYSIMRNIDDSITLKDWIKHRDAYLEIALKHFTIREKPIQYIYRASLDMSISLYKNIILKNNKNVVHGDLHSKNILVSNQFPTSNSEYENKSEKDTKNFILHYANSNFKDSLGFLKEVPCIFIDMGTSKYSATTPEIGINRELKFLYENTRKILKPFFLNSSVTFREIFKYEENDSEKFYSALDSFKGSIELNSVSASLKHNNNILNFFTMEYARLVLFFNHLYGFIGNNPLRELDYDDIISLNSYINGDFLSDYRYAYENKLLSILDTISTSTEDQDYNYLNILDWNEVWNYFNKYFSFNQFGDYIFKSGRLIPENSI